MCRYLSSQTYTPWPDTTRKKTRKGAVYQLARTCTQERLGQSVKIIANADDICSKKQANKITERLRTF